MRKLLGLDGSDVESSFSEEKLAPDEDDDSVDSFFAEGAESSVEMIKNSNDEDEEGVKSFTFTPGKINLEAKIRNKLKDKNIDENEKTELTPWEKYQLKKKEKRKERKKQAKESKNLAQGKTKYNSINENRDEKVTNSGPSTKEELDLLLAGDNGK